MGRRVRKIAAICILMLFGGSIGSVYAANVNAPYIAEQAIGKAPNVEVYMTGSKMGKDTQVIGTIDSIDFISRGDIETFEESEKGISYIILMDNSASVNEAQFEESKRQLSELRKSLKAGDEMTLYTVGTDDAGGEKSLVFTRTVSTGDKKDKKADCKQVEGIAYLSGAESKTVLFRSLNQILQEQVSPKIRTVILLITDGEDDSQGKDIDNVSTVKTVQEASVPVYGILLNRKPSVILTAEEQEERISYTKNEILAEKNCRGYYYDCSVDATEESVKQAFETLRTIWQKETYVVHLEASTNQTAGRGQLRLTADNSAVPEVPADYSDYEEDKDAPGIVGIIEEVGSNSITFTLQDKNGINLTDVNERSNYMVQSAAEKEEGKIWTIDAVSTASKENEATVTLTMTEDFYNGDYILRCSNIRDKSQDANEMDAVAEFSIKNGLDAKKAAVQKTVQSYWWIGLILLVILIGILLIFVVRKRKVEVVQIDPDELKKADSRKIRLTITDRAGIIKDVEWNVEGSLFVGRSNICNIYFDDDRLSKQHFVVEVNKMGCYIEDLESTNGTYVNGVKITSRRMLLDGDVITAGREKIVFHIPKQEKAEQI